MQYTYDALNRLASAQATNSSWGQSYNYDGFGNLTDQNVIAGSAPTMHVAYNASTNRQTGDCADANGNINSSCGTAAYTYDIENRIVGGSGFTYSYAPGNKRLWRSTSSGEEITYYSTSGQKLATYTLTLNYSLGTLQSLSLTQTGTWYYFGGKMIKNASGYVGQDRIGSIGKFFPYGQERSATANNTEKFATYYRDSESGLDYAQNRYYEPGMGRFVVADWSAPGLPTDPNSWNLYAYTQGDPINYQDPEGLTRCGDRVLDHGHFQGQTLDSIMGGTGADDMLAQLMYHEASAIFNPDIANPTGYTEDLTLIGTAVLNQYDVANGRLKVYSNGSDRAQCPLGSCSSQTLQQIMIAMACIDPANRVGCVFNSDGTLADSSRIQDTLNGDSLAGVRLQDANGALIGSNCEGIVAAITIAGELLDGSTRFSPNGITVLFWNQASQDDTKSFPGNVGYHGYKDSRSGGHTLWGLSSVPPPPRVRQKGGRGR